MHEMKIRLAEPSELKAIQDLNYQLFVQDEALDPLLDMGWPYDNNGVEYFESRINGKGGVCFVAVAGDEIVGYVCGGIMKPHSYRKIKKQTEVENTFIKAEYRRRWIGKRLFEALLAWSRQQGAERIFVSAAAGNLNAIEFYKKVGFVDYATDLEYEIK